MCKWVHFQCRGKIEDTGGFCRRFQFGIDNHGKSQLFAQIAHFLAIIGVAYSGNGCAVAHTSGDCAAEQVQFVGIGNCNNQIRIFNARFHLYTVAGAVSHDTHNVVQAAHSLYDVSILVYDGYVMAFLCKLLNEGSTDLATAYYDNSKAFGHIFLWFFKHVCLLIPSNNTSINLCMDYTTPGEKKHLLFIHGNGRLAECAFYCSWQ